MRLIKYKTKMTEDRKAILEKEKSVNIPDVDRKMNSPETEEYLYMICMNTKLDVTSVFELSHRNVSESTSCECCQCYRNA